MVKLHLEVLRSREPGSRTPLSEWDHVLSEDEVEGEGATVKLAILDGLGKTKLEMRKGVMLNIIVQRADDD